MFFVIRNLFLNVTLIRRAFTTTGYVHKALMLTEVFFSDIRYVYKINLDLYFIDTLLLFISLQIVFELCSLSITKCMLIYFAIIIVFILKYR